MTFSRRLCVLSISGMLSVCLVLASTVWAGPTSEEQMLVQDLSFSPSLGVLDANNLGIRASNLGLIMYGIPPGGLEYPLGSGKPLVYGAGVWVGAKVEGDIRIAAGWYMYEFGPGPIDENGQWADASDPLYRVYKIVRGDTSSEDYLNWPSDQGAPLNQYGNPGIIGEQTLWCVYNDADSALHTSYVGGTAPLGIEIQQTLYAFDTGGAFARVAIAELKIINKLGNMLDSAFVSIWSDPDVGSAFNDLVGCDTTLDVGFAYNGSDFDDVYGISSPCVGFDFLKGPESADGEVLGMTAFSKHAALYDPVTYLETYNLMRGLSKQGGQVINPVSGEVTRYQVPGDPVAGTGWLDAPSADKRMVMSAGPFTMAPGDTQTVVVGIIVGHGANRLESINLMRAHDRLLQASFNNGFEWPWKPQFEAQAGDGEIVLTWQNPSDEDFAGTLIRYSTEASPRTPADGLPVANGNSGRFEGEPGSWDSFAFTGLCGGVTHYFTAFSYDVDSNHVLLGASEATPSGSGTAGIDPGSQDGDWDVSVHPNPGNGVVTVRYAASPTGHAEVQVFDTSGRTVRSVDLEGDQAAGAEWKWHGRADDGTEMPPGVYFIRVRSGHRARTTKVVFLR